MENEAVISETPVIPESPNPAPDAEVNKSDSPAAEADDKTSETPEQVEARKESRRQRAARESAAKLAEARTEARMLREQLEKAQAKPEVAAEPKREEFDDLESYHRALARHEAKQIAQQTIDADRKERLTQESTARQQEAERKIGEAWVEREKAFQKQAKDYKEVVPSFIEGELADLSKEGRRAILESELGPEVLYHLAKNPEEAERIASLPPFRQAAEIGKLELKVTPQKKTTNAPAPVSGVRGSSSTQGFSESMSQADYEAFRKKQGARWAR